MLSSVLVCVWQLLTPSCCLCALQNGTEWLDPLWTDSNRTASPQLSVRRGSCTSSLLPSSSKFMQSHQTQPLQVCVYLGRFWQTSAAFGLHHPLDTALERKAAAHFPLLLTEPCSILLALPAELGTDGQRRQGRAAWAWRNSLMLR